ncbi:MULTISPECIES: disulfide bond formation protein DsbA [Mycobacterium avium complex (MAC)]|uniref:mycothiol-dependent nitroreductase Rv2466c family protein n=1 Tax=Mycobacterium avium complex (MAC) TaxID=120793 RepID=UPI001928C0A7|nr:MULTISPECIES: disulfide bond formation protein DsbA [Mycobacterium avium complex (MAC)]MCA2256313.1 disulfide bond formation protein DsbA [Mycobacterium intracellulare]BCO88996.1 DSBA oxidoreductase [Mycobacterium paraintracellulare]
MTSIELYVDPVCPFAWVTSRWLLDAATASERSVNLRQMSLAVLNDGSDVPPPQRTRIDMSRRAGRLFAAATDREGPGAFGDLYEALGARVHTNGEEMTDSMIKEVLAAANSDSSLIGALDEAAWDDAVRAAHQLSQDALGGKGGSPIIAVDGTAFFGPVLTDLPTGDAGIALLDAVLAAASTPGFAVLQRPYQGPPSTGSAGSR